METPFGGLYITGSSTNFNAANAGSELGSTVGWTAIAATTHGDQSVTATTTTGRLTLLPGVYQVRAELTVEGNYSSAQSGDFAGVITAAIHVGGTLLTGAKSKNQVITEGLPMHLSVTAFVEITAAQLAAGTNYASCFLYGGDASGNDVVVSEGRLSAIRLQ